MGFNPMNPHAMLPNPFHGIHPLHPYYHPASLPHALPAPSLSCMYCPASFESPEHLTSHIHFHHLQAQRGAAYPAVLPRNHGSESVRGGQQPAAKRGARGHGPLCACPVCRPSATSSGRRGKAAKPSPVEDIDEETLKKIQALEWERKHG